VSLSTVDRDLVRDCLQGDEVAWRTFCERFAGLIAQVVDQSAIAFEMVIDESTRNELVTEVFSSIFDRNFTLLRRFRGESSLATYLTIIARRIVVKRLQGTKALGTKGSSEPSSQAFSDAGVDCRIDTHSPSEKVVPPPTTPASTTPASTTPEPSTPKPKAH